MRPAQKLSLFGSHSLITVNSPPGLDLPFKSKLRNKILYEYKYLMVSLSLHMLSWHFPAHSSTPHRGARIPFVVTDKPETIFAVAVNLCSWHCSGQSCSVTNLRFVSFNKSHAPLSAIFACHSILCVSCVAMTTLVSH
jgi:hypothetical protein